MSYIVYSLLEASEGEDTVSILIQYAIYILIIVVGIVVLGLIKRRQKPISHDDLRKRLVNLSDNIQKAIECIKSEKYGQYDFLRMMQKLIFSADKLIYQSSILADKERDSAISNIAMAVERAKSLLMEFRAEWKIVETESDTEKLSEAIELIGQAVATIDRILERDRLLSLRRIKKNG